MANSNCVSLNLTEALVMNVFTFTSHRGRLFILVMVGMRVIQYVRLFRAVLKLGPILERKVGSEAARGEVIVPTNANEISFRITRKHFYFKDPFPYSSYFHSIMLMHQPPVPTYSFHNQMLFKFIQVLFSMTIL